MKGPSMENWFHKASDVEDSDGQKFPLVVAVCPDDKGQDIINFVFNKLATVGDHLTILHILDKIPDLPQLPDSSLDRTEAVEAAWHDAHKHQARQQLSLMLQRHKALCQKNMIDVNFHIVRSKTAKEAIVEESATLKSSFLVLGSSTKSAFTGRMSSTARFCCKHPPTGCTVMVIASGAVISTRCGQPTADFLPRQLSVGSGRSHSGRTLADAGRAFSESSGRSSSRTSSFGRAFSRKHSKLQQHFSPLLEAPPSPTSSSSSLSSRNEDDPAGTADSGSFHSSTFNFGSSHYSDFLPRTFTELDSKYKRTNFASRTPPRAPAAPPRPLRINPEASGRSAWSSQAGLQPKLSPYSQIRLSEGFRATESASFGTRPGPGGAPRPPPSLTASTGRYGGLPSPFPSPQWGGPGGGAGAKGGLRRPGDSLAPCKYGWDDNVVGVRSLSRQGSLTQAMAELAHVSTNQGSAPSQLAVLGLAAASGLARQGSGIPSARLAALEMGSGGGAAGTVNNGAGTGGRGPGGVGKANVNSPNSVIHSGGLFSGSLKSLSGSFHTLMAERRRYPEEGSLLQLSALLATCSGGAAAQAVQPYVPATVVGAGGGGSALERAGGSFGVKFFPYAELAKATNEFSAENLVGKGGFAEVFKGQLADSSLVAVKRLFQKKKSEIEFLSEVGIVSHVRHPHATRLLGYSVDQSHRLLVYQLLPQGSLDRNLHRRFRKTLDWPRRLRAALGSAKGLHYLHHDCPRRIIHRDVKSANILLGDDYEAQICDFGLAKWIPERGAFSSLGPVEGTFGYMAPEYFMHGELNEKTDVYAFGIVLLEIITGRRPIEASRPQPEQNLHSWAQPYLAKGDFKKVLDPRLKSAVDMPSLRRMCAAALFCLRYTPDNRPTMGEVGQLLEDSSLSDDMLQKLWPNIVDGRADMRSDMSEQTEGGAKEYTESMYYRDMEQHLAVALANPEGLVRST